MSSFDALLLIGETAVLLYLLWWLLGRAFDAIERWQQAAREHRQAEAAVSLEDSQSLKEREF